MEQSILNSTKKVLGLDPSYTAFDLDVLTHINAVFSTLYQLGFGPDTPFVVEDDTPQWSEFEPDPILCNHIRTYMYLKVRLYFDPPQTSYVIAALEKQIEELEFRLSRAREELGWIDPTPLENIDELEVVDGGDL